MLNSAVENDFPIVQDTRGSMESPCYRYIILYCEERRLRVLLAATVLLEAPTLSVLGRSEGSPVVSSAGKIVSCCASPRNRPRLMYSERPASGIKAAIIFGDSLTYAEINARAVGTDTETRKSAIAGG